MRKQKVFFVTASLLAVLASCQQMQMQEQVRWADLEGTQVARILRPADRVDPMSYLLQFDSRPTEEQVNALYRDGVVSVEPLLPPAQGREEARARFGLDRWFVVQLEEGAALDRSVRLAASLEGVSLVEYNSLSDQDGEEGAFPSYPSTRGTVSSFNDPMYSDQWHYNNQGMGSIFGYKGGDINVKDVWAQLTCGDRDIVVAVVDEGVKYNHPDLKDNMWVNEKEIPGNGVDDDGNGYVDDVYGYNFVTNGPITWDKGYYDSRGQWQGDSGHGTHCAGTIAAVNNNNKGVVGVAGGSGNNDGCRIMSCQIFSGEGGGTAGATARAIIYAAENGASVISCSYGYTSRMNSDNDYINRAGALEINAIHYFESAEVSNNPVLDGNIAVFAAGNEKHDYAHYPGAFVDVLSVSAFGPDFLPAYYTNYGPGCNVAAPGGNYNLGGEKACVLSTLPTELYGSDYGYMQGTSMACPHVSGVVALGLSYAKKQGKKFSVQEFKQLILASTKDIDQRIASQSTSYAKYYHQMGTGAVDAWSLMMHIDGIPCSTATIGSQQWISLNDLFGTASTSLTYLSVDVPQESVDALGLQKISGKASGNYKPIPEGECYAYVQFGRLYIHPTKIGSGKISISMVGGGDHVGGGNTPPGGMLVTEEISIIAREVDGGNGTGGWL